MSDSHVHVVGTGTIGEPLIGLLCRMREPLGIETISFHKETARLEDRAKVRALIGRGALLAAHPEEAKKFRDMGMDVSFSVEDALGEAAVVIDCTPVGN